MRLPSPTCTSVTRDVVVPGLQLIEDFLSASEQEALRSAIDERWGTESITRRRTQHYGYAFCYASKSVDISKRVGDLPPMFDGLLSKIRLAGLPLDDTDQITVNEYNVGEGIGCHIDTHSAFEDAIGTLSLGSGCVMEFRRRAAADDSPQPCDRKLLYLTKGSLLIFKGEARYAWCVSVRREKSTWTP
ncbi:unnamed protein product [Vitrella brassicaformis CCMP3155]|uniref:Alpha-ketoglutarate-dependent dioxygenase AlkB-like domain-containing protein n=1 Tax=Vitrella brassicaformis (strain CCMP3155) TaxID=1169540 RepID=A0A0G4GXL0_VITBC|nr:unnamed protein product [Vitrella brassicaformis CCMP3155]|eukprot:CEM35716.1 unnamed protein product [Vitrella brassicaformis CCMP3155]